MNKKIYILLILFMLFPTLVNAANANIDKFEHVKINSKATYTTDFAFVKDDGHAHKQHVFTSSFTKNEVDEKGNEINSKCYETIGAYCLTPGASNKVSDYNCKVLKSNTSDYVYYKAMNYLLRANNPKEWDSSNPTKWDDDVLERRRAVSLRMLTAVTGYTNCGKISSCKKIMEAYRVYFFEESMTHNGSFFLCDDALQKKVAAQTIGVYRCMPNFNAILESSSADAVSKYLAEKYKDNNFTVTADKHFSGLYKVSNYTYSGDTSIDLQQAKKMVRKALEMGTSSSYDIHQTDDYYTTYCEAVNTSKVSQKFAVLIADKGCNTTTSCRVSVPYVEKVNDDIHNCCEYKTESTLYQSETLDEIFTDDNCIGTSKSLIKKGSANVLKPKQINGSNEYCSLYCSEKLNIAQPGSFEMIGGKYFKMNTLTYKGETYSSPVLDGMKRCRMVINFNEWAKEYAALTSAIVDAYNEMQLANARLNSLSTLKETGTSTKTMKIECTATQYVNDSPGTCPKTTKKVCVDNMVDNYVCPDGYEDGIRGQCVKYEWSTSSVKGVPLHGPGTNVDICDDTYNDGQCVLDDETDTPCSTTLPDSTKGCKYKFTAERVNKPKKNGQTCHDADSTDPTTPTALPSDFTGTTASLSYTLTETNYTFTASNFNPLEVSVSGEYNTGIVNTVTNEAIKTPTYANVLITTPTSTSNVNTNIKKYTLNGSSVDPVDQIEKINKLYSTYHLKKFGEKTCVNDKYKTSYYVTCTTDIPDFNGIIISDGDNDDLKKAVTQNYELYATLVEKANTLLDKLNECNTYFDEGKPGASDSSYAFEPEIKILYTQEYLNSKGKRVTDEIEVKYKRVCTSNPVVLGRNLTESDQKFYGIRGISYSKAYTSSYKYYTFKKIDKYGTICSTLPEKKQDKCYEENLDTNLTTIKNWINHGYLYSANYLGRPKITEDVVYDTLCYWEPDDEYNQLTYAGNGETIVEKSTTISGYFTKKPVLSFNLLGVNTTTTISSSYAGKFQTYLVIDNINEDFKSKLNNNKNYCMVDKVPEKYKKEALQTCTYEVHKDMIITEGCFTGKEDECPTDEIPPYTFKVVDTYNIFPACKPYSSTEICFKNIGYGYNWLVDETGKKVLNEMQKANTYGRTEKNDMLTYSFKLTSQTMKAIREYNKSNSYKDFKSTCSKDCNVELVEYKNVKIGDIETYNITAAMEEFPFVFKKKLEELHIDVINENGTIKFKKNMPINTVIYENSCSKCLSSFITDLGNNKVNGKTIQGIWNRSGTNTIENVRKKLTW